MNYNKLLWIIVIVLISPFVAYGATQVMPFYDSFIVTSGSMEPDIQTGSLLFTSKTDAKSVKVGDTITFKQGGKHTTHKVIEKNISNQTTFRTQGIANESPDPGTVTGDELVGKKLFSLPFLGYILSWAGTKIGIALLIIIPGTLLIFMEIRKIIEESRTK